MDEQLMTTQEVAGYLKVGLKTIQRMCRTGEIQAIKVGSTYRISKEALNEFIANQQKQTKTKGDINHGEQEQ